ncbi:MAG: hypothetical protein P8Z35_19565, partial [Ignavibacteriaceae bacterium]
MAYNFLPESQRVSQVATLWKNITIKETCDIISIFKNISFGYHYINEEKIYSLIFFKNFTPHPSLLDQTTSPLIFNP